MGGKITPPPHTHKGGVFFKGGLTPQKGGEGLYG